MTKFSLFQTATAISIAVMAFATSASAASLLSNGDFEAGSTGFSSDFTEAANITPASTYAITTDPRNNHNSATSYGDHTTGSGNMMAVNGSTISGDVFWRETVTVDVSTDYVFSLFTSTWYGGSASLGLLINGVAVGSTIFTPTLLGVWENSTLDAWSSGASSSATIELINISNQFSGNDFAVDDLSFVASSAPPAPVPIPAGLPLLISGLGAFGLLRRWRKS